MRESSRLWNELSMAKQYTSYIAKYISLQRQTNEILHEKCLHNSKNLMNFVYKLQITRFYNLKVECSKLLII